MKHLYVFILLALTACAPSNPSDIYAEKITAAIGPKLDDPGSFEFVSLDKVDTVTNNQHRRSVIGTYEKNAYLFTDSRDSITLDSFRNALALPDSSDILRITADCQIRAKNKFGALVLNRVHVVFTPAMEVQSWEVMD